MLGGRRLTSRLAPRAGRLQMATGAVMVVVAVLMFADSTLASRRRSPTTCRPSLVNPPKELEESGGVRDAAASCAARGDEGTSSDARAHGARRAATLPMLGAAPDFTGNQHGSTRPAGGRSRLRELRGQVVLVDFWTYTCINCIRTLPYLKAWDARYRDEGLTIVGVHTPEFPFERDAGNVADAIEPERHPLRGRPGQRLRDLERLRQPVLAGEVPDRRPRAGCATCTSARATTRRPRAAIRRLLAEAGGRRARDDPVRGERASELVTTPESYLGAERADRFVNGPIQAGTRTFELPAGGSP